ncbi:unnamed protein product [Haemonchus placei]|uniref:Yippee domain-containing protein n=1 Tax=Haemonchus placei TaxID=6290 RepID=A0A0N4WSU7_HAEPC|nr:unnamed protein product [Haemonchus placei]
MPRMFFEHWGGRRTFSCEDCGTYLSNRQEVVSTRFSGNTGRAFLFRRVANTRQGSPVIRKLTTGNHLVRSETCFVFAVVQNWDGCTNSPARSQSDIKKVAPIFFFRSISTLFRQLNT